MLRGATVVECDLKLRTKAFALEMVRLVRELPNDVTGWVIGRQLLKSGTSVGANYRAARRAKSPADFVAKMSTVEEEADESAFWLELLVESGILPSGRISELLNEANQIVAIAVSSVNTARRNAKYAPSAISRSSRR